MQKKITYRPEIDGLRTIAVLAVLFYHAELILFGKNPIPGGFLGVDIFFVISGYLISLIILKGLATDSFSFLDFYERRARRILPTLFAVITASLPFAWYYLLPQAMREYSGSLVTSIFFSSNFWFWLEDPYWSAGSNLKPFLHTWSLAVEEQFYLVMPFILIVINSYAKKTIFLILIVIAACSLGFAEWASANTPELSFFLLPARMWELLSGVLLAVFELKRNTYFSQKNTYILPLIGLALIIFSFLYFDKEMNHPSLLTLLPVIGTILIIRFANPNDIITKLLSSKIFVAIGLISYGIYMWHFPLFAFSRIICEDLSNLDKILLCFLSIVISTVSFFVIENPFRQHRTISSKKVATTLCSVTLPLLIFGIIGQNNGYSYRFPSFLKEQSRPKKIKNHKWTLSPTSKNKRIIVVGDSHMQALAPALQKLALKAGYDFAVSNFSGCQLLLNTNRVKKSDFSSSVCNAARQEKRLTFIKNAAPSIVILGGRLPLILEEDRFDNHEGGYEGQMLDFIQNNDNSLNTISQRREYIAKAYINTVSEIIKAGHKVVLVYPIPEVGWHVPNRLFKKVNGDFQHARNIASNHPITTDYKVFQKRTQNAYNLLDELNFNEIVRIYPEKLFCNNKIRERCTTHDSENTYYRDDDHLSQYGANLLAKLIMKSL